MVCWPVADQLRRNNKEIHRKGYDVALHSIGEPKDRYNRHVSTRETARTLGVFGLSLPSPSPEWLPVVLPP